jgi:sugar transferase (PEP-CTERM system associated)
VVTPFSRKLAMLAGVELLLAAIVLSSAFLFVGAFLIVVPADQAVVRSHALLAQLTFAMTLLLPAGILGVHRFDRAEALPTFLQKFFVSIGVGILLCYALFALAPALARYSNVIPPAAALGAFGLVIVRLVLVPRLRIDQLQQRVLILGTGGDAAMVAHGLAQLAERGVSVVGFYQTDPSSPVEVPRDRIVPRAESLESLVQALSIQVIVVAVREQRGGGLPVSELLNCRLMGVEVTDVPGVLERVTGIVPVEVLKSSWLIYGKGFAQGWGRRVVKRAFDVVMATGLLVIATPVMIATAIAIFLESGRPIIFRQERVGLGGRPFFLLKFRSMRVDAEKDGIPRWASSQDPRVTPVGRFIRCTRIDELPQIFNVLRGEMSFVGPRPERRFFVDQLVERVPFYGARHTVKPGVTGWAQVRYGYGASLEDATRKLEFDLFYVKNHSLLLDLVILILSVRVVLSGAGAR